MGCVTRNTNCYHWLISAVSLVSADLFFSTFSRLLIIASNLNFGIRLDTHRSQFDFGHDISFEVRIKIFVFCNLRKIVEETS